VVVADLHAIRGFDPASGEPTFTQRNILGVGDLGSAIAVSADGPNLILTSFTDNDVRVWDPVAERTLSRWDGLALPVSAVRFGDGVAVTEHGTGRVLLLTEAGQNVLAEGLEAPTGLASDDGVLYVTERARGQVLLIARDGRAVPPEVVADGLQAPEGIAVLDGSLVVVEAESGRVVRIQDGRTRALTAIAPGTPPASPAQPPAMVLNDVAVHDGVLFATGETGRVLYRIDLP
jgi:glucose/arabinose dehydrogenase